MTTSLQLARCTLQGGRHKGGGEGWMVWVGEAIRGVQAIPDVAGLLLTGNSVSDRWTPWLFIDPCSRFLCPFDCNAVFLPSPVVLLLCLTAEIRFPLPRFLVLTVCV